MARYRPVSASTCRSGAAARGDLLVGPRLRFVQTAVRGICARSVVHVGFSHAHRMAIRIRRGGVRRLGVWYLGDHLLLDLLPGDVRCLRVPAGGLSSSVRDGLTRNRRGAESWRFGTPAPRVAFAAAGLCAADGPGDSVLDQIHRGERDNTVANAVAGWRQRRRLT